MSQPSAARNAAGNSDGKITRELILATALEIIDRDGAGALSKTSSPSADPAPGSAPPTRCTSTGPSSAS